MLLQSIWESVTPLCMNYTLIIDVEYREYLQPIYKNKLILPEKTDEKSFKTKIHF